jgi:hypothetical protein
MLTQCPECRQNISTSTSTCPYCGYVGRSRIGKRAMLWTIGILFTIVIMYVIVNVRAGLQELDNRVPIGIPWRRRRRPTPLNWGVLGRLLVTIETRR